MAHVGDQKSDLERMIETLSGPKVDTLIQIRTEGDKCWEFDAKNFIEVAQAFFLGNVKYVLQRRDDATGQWESKGLTIHGKKLAQRLLNKQKRKTPEQEWRTVPKALADAYKQGWLDHEDYITDTTKQATARRRRPTA